MGEVAYQFQYFECLKHFMKIYAYDNSQEKIYMGNMDVSRDISIYFINHLSFERDIVSCRPAPADDIST